MNKYKKQREWNHSFFYVTPLTLNNVNNSNYSIHFQVKITQITTRIRFHWDAISRFLMLSNNNNKILFLALSDRPISSKSYYNVLRPWFYHNGWDQVYLKTIVIMWWCRLLETGECEHCERSCTERLEKWGCSRGWSTVMFNWRAKQFTSSWAAPPATSASLFDGKASNAA